MQRLSGLHGELPYGYHRDGRGSERERIPVLVSSGEIIWVAGHRMGEPAKITAETQNILKFELLLA